MQKGGRLHKGVIFFAKKWGFKEVRMEGNVFNGGVQGLKGVPKGGGLKKFFF